MKKAPEFIILHQYKKETRYEKLGWRHIECCYLTDKTEEIYVNVSQIRYFKTGCVELNNGDELTDLTETASQIRKKIMRV